jgi:hypothetical protein
MSAAVSARWVLVHERPNPGKEGCYEITNGKEVYTAYFHPDAGWGVIMRHNSVVAVPVAELDIQVTAWLKMKYGSTLPQARGQNITSAALSYRKPKVVVDSEKT